MSDFIRKNWSRMLQLFYAFALFLLNFVRIFDDNFWGDEAYTIRLAQMQLQPMFTETAGDVHPPLYYMLVRLFCSIFGYRGEVFHFVSLIPYGIVMVLALTIVRSRYGRIASLVFMTIASLMPQAVQYNVEVRMYSWGAFFVLLSYLFLWRIFTYNRRIDYVGFTFSSLAAAYTHYYCLVSAAFFYVTLIFVALVRRKDFLKKTLLCCMATVVGYLPWFFILLRTLERTADDFWMAWIPTLRECIAFFFSGSCQYILFAMLMLGTAAFFLQQIRDLKEKPGDAAGLLSLRLSGMILSADTVWCLAGLLSMFGTSFVGIMISRLIRPLFIVRYLYPVSIVAWLLLGFSLSRLKGRVFYGSVVLAILYLSCIPQYYNTYLNDRTENEKLRSTLTATTGEIGIGDEILTDLAQIDWTVSDYYYAGVSHSLITFDSFPELEHDIEYWLILDVGRASENVSWLNAQGYCCEEKVSDGILGTSPVSIYRLCTEAE